MSLNEFNQLHNEIRSFRDNLKKDNTARRQDISVTNRKLQELYKIKIVKRQLEDKYADSNREPENVDIINEIITKLNVKITEIENHLESRKKESKLDICDPTGSINTSSDHNSHTPKLLTMSENFDFKTAATLLHKLDGKIESVHQLIQGIELYEPTLCPAAKPLLLNYVLKVCIPYNDKIRFQSTYAESKSLIADLQKVFLPKHSAPALLFQMQNCKQNNKSIDQYGQLIAELMAKLTLAQAGNANENIEIFRKENEKVAIDVFARGIQNSELRTIIKAQNYQTLNEAINAAKEESVQSPHESAVFHYNNYNNQRRENKHKYYHPRNKPNNRSNSNNFQNNKKHSECNYRQNQNFRGGNANYRGRSRTFYKSNNNNSNKNRSNYQRPNTQQRQFKNQGNVYTVNVLDEPQPSTSDARAEQTFFREQ